MDTPASVPLTDSSFSRTVSDFRSIAGENLAVRFYEACFYCFGSELAIRRLADKYRGSKTASSGWSPAYASHYFKLETPNIAGEERNAETELANLRRPDAAINRVLMRVADTPADAKALSDYIGHLEHMLTAAQTAANSAPLPVPASARADRPRR